MKLVNQTYIAEQKSFDLKLFENLVANLEKLEADNKKVIQIFEKEREVKSKPAT